MVMAGYEYRGKLPFKNVYLTGLVRDEQGRKMSKTLGNSPDPIELIKKYGADGVRVGMLLCAPAGNDIPFDEGLCEQGRNFSNKIWNAFRLIKGWEVSDCKQPESSKKAINWFESKLSKTINEIDESYSKYRISEALMGTYKLVWDDFCSWYLEIVKPNYGSPMDSATYAETIKQLERILKLLHPFMPFLTEEIWHLIDNRKDDIIVADWPVVGIINEELLSDFENTKEVVAGIRTIRKQQNIVNKEQLELLVIENQKPNTNLDAIVAKLGNLSNMNTTIEKLNGAFSFMVKSNEYFIPLAGNIDVALEIEKLQKELDYFIGFLKSVESKLSNASFINNAPNQVVVNEKNKLTDAKTKIKIIETKIKNLS
jgi:valyl-tRNA synthetase